MKINCSINGRAVVRDKAKISVFDNSLFYADGLFETFLAIGDKVIFLEDHLDRMEDGARLIGLDLPCSRNDIGRWIANTVKKNDARIKKVRATITAGDSAFWAGKKSKSRIIVIVTDYELLKKPFRLTIAPFRVDQDNPFRKIKTLSFIIEMTSRKRVYASRYDDGILLNRKGNVAETTSANIFWVKNGVLYTPPISAGCLEGMVRKHILKLAEKNGISAKIKDTNLANFLKADEIFVTSSIKLIVPVSAVTTERVYKYKTGPITKRLKKILWEHII